MSPTQLLPGGLRAWPGRAKRSAYPPLVGHERDGSGPLREPGEERACDAIVLDTNVFGGGRLDIGLLRRWARDAQALGMEVWVPEVVVWELAAHLWEDIEKARQPLAAASAALKRAGLPALHPVPHSDLDDLVRRVERQIQAVAGVVIVDCAPEDALAALRDQVLGHPPAKRRGKDDIRTGAADSAALRSALRFDSNANLVVVSNDDDVSRALTAWGSTAVHYRTSSEARNALFDFGVGPLDLTYAALSRIHEKLGDGAADELVARYLEDWSAVDADLNTEARGFRVANVEIKKLERLVGALPIRTSPEGRASIDVLVSASVQVQVERLDHALFREPQPFDWSCVLRLPLWVEVDRGTVLELGAEQAARVVFAPRLWNDPGDALSDCLDAFFIVPELRSETLTEPGPGMTGRLIHLHNGVDGRLRVHVGEGYWWVTAETEDAAIVLRSTPGRRHGQWSVEVLEDRDPSSLPPTYALSAFWMQLNLAGG